MPTKSRRQKLDVLIDIQAITTAIDKAIQKSSPATVLFSDLCNSTAYKIKRGPAQGLVKTNTHNGVISRAIQNNNGQIVKYIGDEVMAIFTGDEQGVTSAVQAAIEAHTFLDDHNRRHHLTGYDAYQTKTAITQGDVWYFNIEGHAQPDPQGTVVDCAARLTALAKPGQILCSEPVKNDYAGDSAKFGDEAASRPLKGVSDWFNVYEVVPISRPAFLGIAEVAYSPLTDEFMDRSLENGRLSEHFGKHDEALKHYDTILKRDPLHFIANLLVGRIYHRIGDTAKARDYLEKAKASNPFSALAKQIYASNCWHALEGVIEKEEDVDAMIHETEMALSMAERNLDFHTEQLARHALAHYYANKYELSKDKTHLNTALEYCELLARSFERQSVQQSGAFYDTYAYVLSLKDDRESVEKALTQIDKASAQEPRNPYVAKTRANVLVKLRKLEKE